MDLIIDSHAFVCWHQESSKLSRTAQEAIYSPENCVFLSPVCIWKIQTQFPPKITDLLNDIVSKSINGEFTFLPFSLDHTLALNSIEGPYIDPFDRALIAQSRFDSLTIITHDQIFSDFGISTLW